MSQEALTSGPASFMFEILPTWESVEIELTIEGRERTAIKPGRILGATTHGLIKLASLLAAPNIESEAFRYQNNAIQASHISKN